MKFDALYNPYPSRRSVVYARNGMVATSQALAAQAGLAILRKGGNAVDAAVATAVCLTVVEPTSNGIGGDAFALVWVKDKLYGLNASGPAPTALSPETVRRQGHKVMPNNGWLPVTVPGAPAAWGALVERFGRLTLPEIMAPAIEYAAKGFPVSPIHSLQWEEGFKRFSNADGAEFKYWFDTFAPQGHAPRAGEIWSSSDHAATLQLLAESKTAAFYQGELADKIVSFAQKSGGFIRESDLAGFRPEWVEPIHINYRGYDIWEIPPNGHGLITLMALNILKGFTFTNKESVETYHKQFEAMKLAFADGLAHIADPRKMRVSVEDLLSDSFAAERRKLIGSQALQPMPVTPPKGGTVYLATADAEGNMVSYIQSNYMGFGSGLVVPNTGIALHNRGCNFSLDPSHPNCLEPGKKPYHTIIPGFMTQNGRAVGPFGVMGAFVQPQGHLQMVMNTIDFQLNPQAALDAPRWQWTSGKTILVENQFPEAIAEALVRRGHDIGRTVGNISMGRGQIIWRDEHGVLAGGTEPRTDGTAAAW
ncbi:gamma-glutamyltransferase family protein [Sporomusa acidovorans]|uniref:Glutathione hydrolase-like YwrD proenzyme n=1 Tax=Sporomusa acidovorans (strain ATCC 49682 / DSM 3132 / Mol) TaxID=1123286 RepID=A0ABZ3J921_SPOA4|nr:gamma-glutamyltransferase family protein [Sporomusa acidovorans]OZC24128.1 putative gamma-glutamyltransferase YwrD [Sporomusa acidovorans DSM 3132]SDF71682.1 gamma-glutamyltransferase 2. Threonine peptidase. MEROPS family T03 [Sporomusa acidovorans]